MSSPQIPTPKSSAIPSSSPSHIPVHTTSAPTSSTNIPLPVQQQLDHLQLSTNMKFESLASNITQHFDQLLALLQSSSPPSCSINPSLTLPHPHTVPVHSRSPFGSFQHTPPPPHPSVLTNPPTDSTAIRSSPLHLDAPKFDGQDSTGWLFHISEYFDFYGTAPDERLRLVGLLLEGPASEWFQWVRNNIILIDWDDFVAQVRLHFDPDHFEDYFGALSKLQQTSTVLDYQTEFERLLNKVTGVSEPALISVFIAGLQPLLRRDLNLRRPPSLAVAFALARELSAQYADTISAANPPQRRQWASSPTQTPSLPLLAPTTLPAQAPRLPHPAPRADRPIRRLTTAEKLAKDAQGLCYWCDQKWNRNHRCQSRLLLFIGDEDDFDPSTPLSPSDDAIPTADVSTL